MARCATNVQLAYAHKRLGTPQQELTNVVACARFHNFHKACFQARISKSLGLFQAAACTARIVAIALDMGISRTMVVTLVIVIEDILQLD